MSREWARASRAGAESFRDRIRIDSSHGNKGQLISRDEHLPNRHVLVVGDDPQIRQLVCRALNGAGFTCTAVGNADGVLRYLQQLQVDAITLDLTLPGLSGAELLRELKESFPEIPVVVLTGRTDLGGAIAALHNGANAYLVKPVEMDELVRHVEQGLRRGRNMRRPG